MLKVVKSNEFVEEVKDGIVVIDFFADWCGPCKMLGPVVEELSDEMSGEAKFIKVNVDESPDLASQYGIVNIPALVIMKNGEKMNTMVGFSPKENIRQEVEKYK
ncbi:thioredoxin [Lachnospiraceae bacterium KM106-2]|nr:thioredoxin [Lachnospiraceae bacterium KM106-2]